MALTKEVKHYAQRLQTIGEIIEEISNTLNAKDEVSVESEFAKYNYALDSLKEVKPVKIVSKEHGELIILLEQWISVAKGQYSEKRAKLKELNFVSNEIVTLSNVMVSKLVK